MIYLSSIDNINILHNEDVDGMELIAWKKLKILVDWEEDNIKINFTETVWECELDWSVSGKDSFIWFCHHGYEHWDPFLLSLGGVCCCDSIMSFQHWSIVSSE